MEKTIKSNFIYVKYSKKIGSRGVFADRNIIKDEVIEYCPLILLPIGDLENIKKTSLRLYYFEYSKNQFCIALGFGSLYNHAYKPNADYDFDYKNKVVKVYALKDIGKDEEIFINYNYFPEDKTPLKDWYHPKLKVK